MSVLKISLRTFSELARESGLALIGLLSREKAEKTLKSQGKKLCQWQEHGYAGDMSYMQRKPALFVDLKNFLSQVRSVALFAVPYYHGDPKPPEWGFGRVARYAWGRDYHHVLKKRLKALIRELSSSLNGEGRVQYRIFADAVPLLERTLAQAAELGFVGKNTMLIRHGVGSYFFIGEILCNVEIEFDKEDLLLASTNSPHVFLEENRETGKMQLSPPGRNCKTCSECLVQCPTEAIVEPGMLDARRCISYLTIEKKSGFSSWERRAVGDWIFGCDLCQEVCPFNRNIPLVGDEEFSPQMGVGPYLELSSLLELRTSADFLGRFTGTALLRAGREALIRNACCAAANARYYPAVPALSSLLKSDPSELVRSHAKYALEKLAGEADGLDKKRIEGVFR